MRRSFGCLSDGTEVYRYTISRGNITACITDLGATLVNLLVDDVDVVLGYNTPQEYRDSDTFFGAIVGRNANRIANAAFTLNGRRYMMDKNDNARNNLHSGRNFFKDRIWTVTDSDESMVRMTLSSPDGDQGFPGNATISVTYRIEPEDTLTICYDALCDRDTVFNMTNHSYFNLAGHHHPERAMGQTLILPSRYYTPSDEFSIPTGEKRSVTNTPMDFRIPKAVGADLSREFEAFTLQGGYDHNFEVFANPCAILCDPESGRTMAVSTDCPGIQVYSANYLNDEKGKDGAIYCRRGGICLETQFFPNSVNYPDFLQPVTPAMTPYHSQTSYRFR